MNRSSGVLMHISSLPSPWGIGTFGKKAYEFVEFLNRSGQNYWQILPINPTSFGDSPYQSFSTFAGNPYFIDLDKLEEQGYLDLSDYQWIDWGTDCTKVDYGKLYENRFLVLKKAYTRWKEKNQELLSRFRQVQSGWIEDYALFMALKYDYNGKPWYEWDQKYRLRDTESLEQYKKEKMEDINFWIFTQYIFFEQWRALKKYANQKNVHIIGDIPIYVARDSADVWANPEIFWLDSELMPVKVAGCPPDAFSQTGQLWGNPLYRWDVLKERNYDWWMQRIQACAEIYDIIRIDHFRGFDSYYAIPFGDDTAEFGEWMPGPGFDFFKSVRRQLGKLEFVAENLGFLTESVDELLRDTGFPGMKILEFAFDSRETEASGYLPHSIQNNCVMYTGTHDNETIMGWFATASEQDIEYCKKYLRLNEEEGYHWGMIKAAWASVADLCVTQMQDFYGLGSESRMNTPSTVGKNWLWRLEDGKLSKELAKKIYDMSKLYGRIVVQ